MIFQREGCQPVLFPSLRKMEFEISRTRRSFAHLTNELGAYIQVAGGPGLFAVERRDQNGIQYRAWQEQSKVPHPDGTILSFSAGQLKLASREWFIRDQVNELFAAFANGSQFPSYVQWKKCELQAKF